MTGADSADRRAAVISSLKANPGGVSGEALAQDLGVSRVAIGKHVRALSQLGYVIDAVAGRGYRLVSSPDIPLPYEVAPLLTSRLWTRLEGGGAVSSTNDACRALARAGAPEGTVVLASQQSAGRGRLGRTWDSPPGGVYISALLRPEIAPIDASPLPLAVGLGVARGLESLGARVGLKWPNDVFAVSENGEPGGKIAGILMESMVEGETLAWAVAGVGIDVRPSPDASVGWTSLDEITGRRVPLARVAAAVLDAVADAYAHFLDGGFDPLAAEYEARSVLTGRDVAVFDSAGRTLAEGTVTGVDGSGRLEVRTPQGTTVVAAGDVTLRRPVPAPARGEA